MTRNKRVATLLLGAAGMALAGVCTVDGTMPVRPSVSDMEFISVARHPRLHEDHRSVREPGGTAVPMVRAAPPPAIAPDYAAEFALASDYYDFARRILAPAQDGDHDAQFYLFQALRYCDEQYRTYFFDGSRERSFDEGIEWASTPARGGADTARIIHLRCRSLAHNRDESLSTADDWLRRSTEGGHPRAQTVSAEELLLDAALATRKLAPSGGRPALAAAYTQAARDLLQSAARSRDPAVLWTIADLLPAISSDMNAVAARQWVWRLAACQRSDDCGLQAQWYEFGCRFYVAHVACRQGDSGGELIRRAVGEEYPQIERRARELNARMDAGKLAASDFD